MNGTGRSSIEYSGTDHGDAERGGATRHGASVDTGPSRRRFAAAPPRISCRAAGRILNGQDGGRGTEDLRTLIAVASAPAPVDAAHTQSPALDAVLTAYRRTAATPQPTAGRRAARTALPRRRAPRGPALRFAAAVLIVCGGGVAAASVGVLPPDVQRIAYDYFGVGSAPAPSTHVPTTSPAGAPGSSANRSATPPPTTSAAATDSVVIRTLCQTVANTHGDWHAGLAVADQTTLITAAGDDHKVKGYCARLLAKADQAAGSSSDATDAPDTPGPAGTPSGEPTPTPTPSAGVTETHGNAHVSHPPKSPTDAR